MMIADIAGRLHKGLWLTAVAAITSFPYLFYQTLGPWSGPIARDWGIKGEAGTVFAFQFSLLAAIALLCAIIGVFLSERYNLPGFGDPRESYRAVLRYGGLAAIGGLIVGWTLHDRFFYQIVPENVGIELYPRSVLWSVSLVMYTSIMKEMIFRFGMLTLMAGLFRGKYHYLAVVLTSIFASAFSLREFQFVDYPKLDINVWLCVAWSLISNFVSGLVFIKKGLWPTMAIRACIDSRYIIFPILGMV